MFTTVDGIYHDGQVQLNALPADISNDAQVLVTFLEPGHLSAEQIRALVEHLETMAGIYQGLDQVNAGQSQPVADFAEEMQHKYDISS